MNIYYETGKGKFQHSTAMELKRKSLQNAWFYLMQANLIEVTLVWGPHINFQKNDKLKNLLEQM